MILERVEQWKLNWKSEGRQEGEAAMLLHRRFGALLAWATERVQAAEPAVPETWLDRIFDAPRLADVIGDAPV